MVLFFMGFAAWRPLIGADGSVNLLGFGVGGIPGGFIIAADGPVPPRPQGDAAALGGVDPKYVGPLFPP